VAADKEVLRNWDFTMTADRTSTIPMNQQIAQALVERIRTGLLRPGTSLPGSRALALTLGVNRKTVVTAYDELTAQGWLIAQGKRGTFVSPDLPVLKVESKAEELLRRSGGTLPGPDYRTYGTEMKLPEPAQKGVIDFTDGAPDTRVVPFGALSRAFRHALIESARGNQLGSSDPRGLDVLRKALAAMLRIERGLNADEDTICLVRGSQMGIYLAARILVRPGDTVALEALTYPPARDAFRACGASVVSVAQDDAGMIPESLERICRTHRIRAIYITPHHQFPTTVTMTVERRMRLLALAEQFDFVIVEDDYDHEFHFAHNPMLPMASVDRWGKVIYIGSLSKILAPGLRVGYVVAPRSIVNRMATEIMLIDRQGNSVTERAVSALMQSGELKRHIRRAVQIYEARCTFATSLVRDTLQPYATLNPPDGGLALWLEVDSAIDMIQLEKDARRAKVNILPGALFSDDHAPVNALRLGYGALDERELQLGFTRLKKALVNQKEKVTTPAGRHTARTL
jgi:GntR family transcriptional regulator / MocR family aminotransferase